MLSIAKNLLYSAKKSEISPRLLGGKTQPLRWRWEDCPSFAKRDEQQRCGGSSITTTLRQHNAQTKPRICHSMFAMSLARSFLSDPHGMIFIHASCDHPLMNSPITNVIGSFIANELADNKT